MPPRPRRAHFGAPDSDAEPVNPQPLAPPPPPPPPILPVAEAPEDTSGDVAMARRIQRELDQERRDQLAAVRQQLDQQRALQRAQQEANRREAIRRVGEGVDPYREQFMMWRPPRPPNAVGQQGRHFAIGRNFGDYVEQYAHRMAEILAGVGLPAGLPPGLMGPDPRAVQEQQVRDSWAGINFVPRQNPLLGFTFDFDKDGQESAEPTEIVRLDFDDDAPIIEELKASGTSGKTAGGKSAKDEDGLTSLVCASCHLPLRVSQGQRNEGDRVFSLQCGHLVDKRCLDDISQPKQENGHEEQESKPGFKKVGSSATSRIDGFVVNGEYGQTPLASTSALPRIASPSSPSSPTVPVSSPPHADGHPSRRTRSAAKKSVQELEEESDSPQEDVMDDGDFPPSRTGRKIRGRKRKAAARPKRGAAIKKLAKPEEKREYKWLCPVLACGKEHYSEEIGGVWRPKDGMTVQLFV
ncbi:hypothetical protein NliqN6_3207 [Naganishia liquefaciens]|uniref:Uncharacterized protein n=1 Tax=Naganishia liquefaciens TaxID=104408 RepID=A0A8H3TU98_9TREE|nr:hypothetical protein NliqN6_3207 [Naganishia liquefaciens]